MFYLQPGEVFAGDFRIERPLAMGGMGAVFVAEQLSTGRRRALKLMLPSIVDDPRTRERFEQEARVASRIHSDHVVEVVAAGIDPRSGAPWLAMELLDGETLAQRITRTGPLDAGTTLEVFRQMCHALGAAHDAGLVHRDIKPDNLFLATPRREGVPFTLKILDFGIAKLNENARSVGGATRAVGSPLWMAPEQTTSATVQPATDVWALGLVAFFCLTARSYWRAGNSQEATLQELMREVVMDPLEPASRRAAALGVAQPLPSGFDAWFANATSRDPQQRYPNAGAAVNALAPLLAGSTVSGFFAAPSPTGPVVTLEPFQPRPRRSSGAMTMIAVGLGAVFVVGLLAVGTAAFAYFYSTEPDGSPSASAATASATAPAPTLGTTAEGPAVPTAATATTAAQGAAPSPKSAAQAKPTAKADGLSTGVPAGYRPRGAKCAKGPAACNVNCCQPGDLLSAFPECACYWKPPATSKPAGAKPRGTTCSKSKDYCTINCCAPGDFLAPFPECACYFLPPAGGDLKK